MSEIIELYQTKDLVDEVLNNNDKYLKLSISENTLEALKKKADFIMSKQTLDWKPLFIERKDFIRVYNKIYYYPKY